MKKIHLALCSIVLIHFLHCKVLFWRDAVQYAGGTWKDAETFVEAEIQYKSKLSWNPLNQNEFNKNFKTSILIHKISGLMVTKTTVLQTFDGWTLNDSVYLLGDRIILIRGTDDNYGSENREVISIEAVDIGRENSAPITNLFIDYLKKESGSRKYSVLAAIPSPDSKYTALFYSFGSILQPSEEISLAIFSSMDWKATNLTTFKGHYFSTLPPVSWSKDSGKIFILRENDVVEVKPNGKQFVQSNVFPECFVPTESGSSVSESGIEFARIEEEKKIELRRNSSVKFSKVRMVSDFKKIGINCRS